MGGPKKSSETLEGNMLAILDSFGIREARDVHDDRLSFLEAVRAAFFASVSPSPPTRKMFEAIIHILRNGKSLELAMASFHLLADLDKRYPRVYLKKSDNPESNSSDPEELVVNKEAWSPFTVGSGNAYCEPSELCGISKNQLDYTSLCTLVEEIAINSPLTIKSVQNMLLFQYLVRVLEVDFLPRLTLCKGTLNWNFLKESILGMLLASRKVNHKNLAHYCISIISSRFFHEANFCLKDLKSTDTVSIDLPQPCNIGLCFVLPEIQWKTSDAAQKLLILLMELDVIRKDADACGLTTRLDGFRVSIVDIILDDLTYNKDKLSPFLEAFGESKWKLKIILLYFGKYYSRLSMRTRGSKILNNDTLKGILHCFSNPTTTGGILKNMISKVACLLLAQAFKCYLSLQHDQQNAVFITEHVGGSTLLEICNSLIAAFTNLRNLDESLELSPLEKQALVTAAALMPMKS